MKTIVVRIALLAGAGLAAVAAVAQLGGVLPPVGGVVDRVAPLTDAALRPVATLASARLDRIAALVRDYPRQIVLDSQGFPARAGEVLVDDPDDSLIAAATAKGFRVIERDSALGVGYARLATPPGASLGSAVKTLRKLGAHNPTADQLYTPSGAVTSQGTATGAGADGTGPRVGIIDGGVAGSVAAQRGFAAGAPKPSDHGTAVASLIAGRPGVRGATPGARLFAADVYGNDPAGGSALMIAKALAWLAEERVPVVTISLVGPANPLLARVVAAAQARGVILVAAVGNDGPSAPLAYPASYPGVIAVTGVDRRKRVLIEAGRASHLDYAAPGADMLAANSRGGVASVRGTSFAAPLVAASIARVYASPDPALRAAALARIDAGAQRLGKRYGRGLVCGDCATAR